VMSKGEPLSPRREPECSLSAADGSSSEKRNPGSDRTDFGWRLVGVCECNKLQFPVTFEL
jgi:hypothetical protein